MLQEDTWRIDADRGRLPSQFKYLIFIKMYKIKNKIGCTIKLSYLLMSGVRGALKKYFLKVKKMVEQGSEGVWPG